MKFCEKIKLLRQEREMSLTEFAEILGTSKQLLSRYETGKNSPKIKRFLGILKYLVYLLII